MVIRYKARLVANGYSQVEGVNFGETLAPMAKFNTIKIILTLRASMNLKMHQMDVKMAILNDELDVEIYMEQSEEFEQKGQEHLICKLKKLLYMLK